MTCASCTLEYDSGEDYIQVESLKFPVCPSCKEDFITLFGQREEDQ